MAAVRRTQRIDFLDWMVFGVPLALGLAAAVVILVHLRLRPGDRRGRIGRGLPEPRPLRPRAWVVCALVACTVGLWLTERLHGWPAWTVALGAVIAIPALGLLGPRDARHIDWGTLLLVAGGMGLGALLDRSGAVRRAASWLPVDTVPPVAALFGLCLASAVLSALMSNTATATFLIPFAATIDPSPSTVVLIAVAASLGMPFVISTPPNAMAVAHGLPSRDLIGPGMLLMVGGCAIVALTGPWVLRASGVP